ncbi:MAG: 50S ribosomal protein L32 [Candidatus Azambacteria bacterium]|nr:50S ribosomal protein L32 [Candidatus Azambacteria bacterium]
MGGVQPKRHTSGKRNRRRSHLALTKTFLSTCPKCDRAILPHHICAYCGFYNGKEIIDVMANLDKKQKKKRLKEEAAAHTAHGPEELSKK